MANTVAYRFLGDVAKARSMVGFGNLQLDILKRQMELGGLDQYRRIVSLPDGTSFLCTSVFGISTVNIFAPVSVPVTVSEEVSAVEEVKKTYFKIKIFRDDDLTTPIGDDLDLPYESRRIQYFDIWSRQTVEPRLFVVSQIVAYDDNAYYKYNADGTRMKDDSGNDIRLYNTETGFWEFDCDYLWDDNNHTHPIKTPYMENGNIVPAEFYDDYGEGDPRSKYVKMDKNGFIIRVILNDSITCYYDKDGTTLQTKRTEGKYPGKSSNTVWYRDDCIIDPSGIEFSVPYWNTVELVSVKSSDYANIIWPHNCIENNAAIEGKNVYWQVIGKWEYSSYLKDHYKTLTVKSSVDYTISERVLSTAGDIWGFYYDPTGTCDGYAECYAYSAFNAVVTGEVLNQTFLVSDAVDHTETYAAVKSMAGVVHRVDLHVDAPATIDYTATCGSKTKTTHPWFVTVIRDHNIIAEVLKLQAIWNEF